MSQSIPRRRFLQVSGAALVTSTALPPVQSVSAEEEQKGHEGPQFLGGAGRAGWSPDESLRPPFKLLWTYRLDGDASGDVGGGVTVCGRLVFVNIRIEVDLGTARVVIAALKQHGVLIHAVGTHTLSDRSD